MYIDAAGADRGAGHPPDDSPAYHTADPGSARETTTMTNVSTDIAGEIATLRQRLADAGLAVDGMLELAVRAVVEQDVALTERVIGMEIAVGGVESEVEQFCLRLMALHAPTPESMRECTTAIRLAAELKHISDYALDIAKIGRRLVRHNVSYRPLVDLPRLMGMARAMLRDALESYARQEDQLVDAVIAADDRLDDVYHQYRDYAIEAMRQDTSLVLLGAFSVLATKYVERIGDHIISLAESVHYLITGRMEALARTRRQEP